MTKLEIKGTWNEVKGKLKQKYAQLSDVAYSVSAVARASASS